MLDAKTEREHARESIHQRASDSHGLFALENFTRKRLRENFSPAKKPPSTGSASLASGEMQCARDANEEKVVRRALCVCVCALCCSKCSAVEGLCCYGNKIISTQIDVVTAAALVFLISLLLQLAHKFHV